MADDKRKAKNPTKDELAERIDLCRRLVALRVPKSVIVRKLRAKYGNLSHVTIGRYLLRAREDILLAVSREKLEQRGNSLALYESVLADPKATCTEKIKAQERIDKLLGLEVKLPANPETLLEAYGIRPDEAEGGTVAELPQEPADPEGPAPVPGLQEPPG